MTDRTRDAVMPDQRVREEAADWFVRVNGEEPPLATFQVWQQWLGRSPAHQKAYREIEETWQAWEGAPKPPWPGDRRRSDPCRGDGADEDSTSERPLRRSSTRYDTVLPIGGRADSRDQRPKGAGDLPKGWWQASRWTNLRVATPLAAIGIALVAALFLGLPGGSIFPRSTVLKTAAGENREFILADGSRVTLGAETLVTTDLSRSTRSIIIDYGEAYFEVTRESRPFVVRAGSGTITALGTAFNVHYVEGRVVVTVAEGSVEVAEMQVSNVPNAALSAERSEATPAPPVTSVVRLAAGEQATYGVTPMAVQAANVELAKAWQIGQLRYIAEPLEFVLPDVSRYTRTQLVIADEAVGELRYTGTVLQDDVDHWLESLSEVFPIDVVRVDADTVLLKSAARADRP